MPENQEFNAPKVEPPKLDIEIDRGSNFTTWKNKFKAYRRLSKLDKASEETQVDVLTLCMSSETIRVVDNLGLPPSDQKDCLKIIDALERHVNGQINVTVERFNFRQRRQDKSEPFDDYLITLRELAKTCRFCNDKCTEAAIRDQIIEGHNDPEAVKELLEISELTLSKTIDKCRALEAAKIETTQMCGSKPNVNVLQSSYKKKKQSFRPGSPVKVETKPCGRCGAQNQKHDAKNCPASSRQCYKCGKIGHYAHCCRTSKVGFATKRDAQDRKPTSRRLGVVRINNTSVEGCEGSAPTIRMHTKTRNGEASQEILPDSGSEICAGGIEFLQRLNERPDNLLPSKVIARTANGIQMNPIGCLPVEYRLNGRTVKKTVHIYKGMKGGIISWNTAKEIGILPEHYPKPLPQDRKMKMISRMGESKRSETGTVTKEDLIKEFPEVFDGKIKTMPGEKFKITLDDKAKPFNVSTPRFVPFPYREPLRKEIDFLVSQGLIAPVTEPIADAAATWDAILVACIPTAPI